jgi:hypothetical protein
MNGPIYTAKAMKTFAQVLDSADELGVEEQESLVEVLQRRLAERRREALLGTSINDGHRLAKMFAALFGGQLIAATPGVSRQAAALGFIGQSNFFFLISDDVC